MLENFVPYYAAAALLPLCLAVSAARAAEDPAGDKPRVVVLCPECGMVYNIRRIDKPVAPERNLLPNNTSAAQGGSLGNGAQAAPLFSFGSGGPQRVQRQPTTQSVWELTVRYDNGQFGFVTQDNEPDFKVGDRVRHIENTFEPIAQPAR